MKVYLVRHAECSKNLIGIPGGKGSPLTPAGLLQAQKVAEELLLRVSENSRLIACPRRQAVETAVVIGQHIKQRPTVEPLFGSIFLGVLNGVPIKQASVHFPESSASMEGWRSNLSEIADLQIEGMENPWEFYYRGLRGISKYSSCDELVVCCTTSIMILLEHASNKITPRKGDGYKSIEYRNAQIVGVEFDRDCLNWIERTLMSNEG